MRFTVPRLLVCALALLAVPAVATAQEKKDQPPGQQQGDKDSVKKVDEYAEAAAALNGPAGHPECVWIGRRIVNLMWRDDIDTAFRHLDMYDRFTCPGGHIQATFRCVVRLGAIDDKAKDALGTRVHQCWMNPAQQPPATASAPANPAPAAPPQSTGTNQ